MRLNESEQVKKDLSENLDINLTVVDASQLFLDGLKGIDEPEKKRKFIGMIRSPHMLCCLALIRLKEIRSLMFSRPRPRRLKMLLPKKGKSAKSGSSCSE